MRNNARINKPDVAENLLEKYVIIIRFILLELWLYLFSNLFARFDKSKRRKA